MAFHLKGFECTVGYTIESVSGLSYKKHVEIATRTKNSETS